MINMSGYMAQKTKYCGSGTTREVAGMLKFPRNEEGVKERRDRNEGVEGMGQQKRRGERK